MIVNRDNSEKFNETITSLGRSLAMTTYEREKHQILNIDYERTSVPYLEHL
jgi:hypothetical protein